MVLKFLQVKEEDTVRVKAEPLRELVSRLFQKLGVSKEDSDVAADILVASDLRGVDSHGVCYNIKRNYLPGLTEGRINPRPMEKVVHETLSTALIDGDLGLGHPAAYRGMELAMKKARQVGVGIVSIRNSTHIGMVGYYPLMAVQQGMIGVAMTAGGPPTVLPTYGAKTMLSTSPLSIGAPAGKHPAFLLDMATSVVAGGKFQIASLLNVPIPEGWALDENLQPTTDAKVAYEIRNWLPLGGTREQGGHKGYGLALAVDILCGVLSGHGYDAIIPPHTLSHFIMAIDIAGFRPVEEFKAMMDEMIDAYHNSPKAPGYDRIYIAGEPEWEIYTERTQRGIPIHKEVLQWLTGLASEMDIDVTLV